MDVEKFVRHLCRLVLRHQMPVWNYFVNSFYSERRKVNRVLIEKYEEVQGGNGWTVVGEGVRGGRVHVWMTVRGGSIFRQMSDLSVQPPTPHPPCWACRLVYHPFIYHLHFFLKQQKSKRIKDLIFVLATSIPNSMDKNIVIDSKLGLLF
jgi:hypothetical protein